MLIDKLNLFFTTFRISLSLRFQKVQLKNNNFKMFKLKNFRLIFKILRF